MPCAYRPNRSPAAPSLQADAAQGFESLARSKAQDKWARPAEEVDDATHQRACSTTADDEKAHRHRSGPRWTPRKGHPVENVGSN